MIDFDTIIYVVSKEAIGKIKLNTAYQEDIGILI
jgi:hypothetical protein